MVTLRISSEKTPLYGANTAESGRRLQVTGYIKVFPKANGAFFLETNLFVFGNEFE